MSIISNEHQSGSPFGRDEDTKPREPGCKCHWEEGDSPCPVHGENEKGPIATSHQPGSPPVDLDALERRLELDLGSWGNSKTKYAAVFAELRTLRARVVELEAMNQTQVDKLTAVERLLGAEADKLEERAESAEARVKELEAAMWTFAAEVESRDRRITDLESQLAAAREEQGLEAKVREVLGERFLSLSIVGCFDDSGTGYRAYWPGPRLTPARAAPPNPLAVEPTIPALLRAILEVEAQP